MKADAKWQIFLSPPCPPFKGGWGGFFKVFIKAETGLFDSGYGGLGRGATSLKSGTPYLLVGKGGGGILVSRRPLLRFFALEKGVFDGIADEIVHPRGAHDFQGFHIPQILHAVHGVRRDDPDIPGF